MKVVLQRVDRASVQVADDVVSRIGSGFCIFAGIETKDTAADVDALVAKTTELRVFADEEGKMNRSIEDVAGQILIVSQFTLLGDVRRGRRPSFSGAAAPEIAAPLIDRIARGFTDRGIPTQSGLFGTHMKVDLSNDGPVTMLLTVRDGKVS